MHEWQGSFVPLMGSGWAGGASQGQWQAVCRGEGGPTGVEDSPGVDLLQLIHW